MGHKAAGSWEGTRRRLVLWGCKKALPVLCLHLLPLGIACMHATSALTYTLFISDTHAPGPCQEGGHVLGLLGGGGGGAVVVLGATVNQHLGHGDGAAGEVGVVVQTLADLC